MVGSIRTSLPFHFMLGRSGLVRVMSSGLSTVNSGSRASSSLFRGSLTLAVSVAMRLPSTSCCVARLPGDALREDTIALNGDLMLVRFMSASAFSMAFSIARTFALAATSH